MIIIEVKKVYHKKIFKMLVNYNIIKMAKMKNKI